ncbi:transglycosylase domain-containing protein [Shouchella clausii]|uniref:Monofunctional biosynthetic peptidoglycan transglycosylase n=1 Tax=Shouchella clausii TaxID=79880 RepID=A0A268S5Q5_SHOCL|nr:PBP1A family penicillin-binding protein [Shouchella clausii]PAD40729.1 monofunctional biosynthetic peptidoglycan transglycosylase [Bacillus sp. 7520-S]MBU8595792.1 PBP1A family penicillin-binding protein [Shouchella clausii]MCY1103620.1 PBP1A family penicillin-binding protein [Shouchella clausii]MEB5478813.1 PBP1A family penicillin-binding protein [Shouchella clausii]MED4159665.1 PBP1A family penicillin-binding protein [Shouchella clausii]
MQTVTRKKRKRFRKIRLIWRLLLLSLIVIALGIILLLSYTRMQGPPPIDAVQTTQFLAADGTVMGKEEAGQNRFSLPLAEMSPYLLQATIAIEDRKFYSHYGFDLKRIGGALLANLQSGSKAQGASTITQQYARNLYLSHEKTYMRKWNELLYALRLEMNFSKDEILAGYLNTVYYGHGAYGVEAAAQHFFGKSAKDVSLAEAAMLAGIPKGPSYYSPLNDLEKAKSRQELILDSMVGEGMIEEAEADKAKAEKLVFADEADKEEEEIAPYFQDHVKALLHNEAQMDEAAVDTGGLIIETTLDPALQQQAEDLVEKHMPDNGLQVALIAMDPRNGEVKALVGGTDYNESSYNRATQAMRNPGSTIKPFLYYAALENGFTPVSTFLSEATSFSYDDGREDYAPSNYNDIYANDFITMLEAIAYSDNIYAMKTHLSIGTDELVNVSEKLGLGTFENRPSLALGAQPVTVLDIANAYAALADGGKQREPVFIRQVRDGEGNKVYEQKPPVRQVLREDTAFVLTDMLRGVFEPALNSYTSVTGASVAAQLTHPTAGKSGSTPRDSWMVGYTPQLVTAVWVGFDKDKDINQSVEGQISKRIWADFMEAAMANELKLPFKEPPGVEAVDIDPHTGLLTSDACPNGRTTYFLAGTAPVNTCAEPEAAEDLQEEPETKDPGFFKRFFKWFSIEDGDPSDPSGPTILDEGEESPATE